MKEGYHGKRINSLDELADFLDIKKSELTYYANNMAKNVRTIEKKKKNGNPRRITAPSKKLTTILRQVRVCFFNDYTFPSYIYGLGGNTLPDHAKVHAGYNEVIQVDLTDFFPSIKHRSVYQMWMKDFFLPYEVARILTMLTAMNGSLQQGFATSSHIAAVVALPLTKNLNTYSIERNMQFTQYVDDLNFSGNNIDKKELFKNLIDRSRENGLSVKKKKTNAYNNQTGKTITGVSLFGTRIRTPKDIRKRSITALKLLEIIPKDDTAIRSARGYQGYLNHLNKQEGKNYKKKVDVIIKRDT